MPNLLRGSFALLLALAACTVTPADDDVGQASSAQVKCISDWGALVGGANMPADCAPTQMIVSLVTLTPTTHQYVKLEMSFQCSSGASFSLTRVYTVAQTTNDAVDSIHESHATWLSSSEEIARVTDLQTMVRILSRRNELIAGNVTGNAGRPLSLFLDVVHGHFDVRPCGVASVQFLDDIRLIQNTPPGPTSSGCQSDSDCAYMCSRDTAGECYAAYGGPKRCHKCTRGVLGTCGGNAANACWQAGRTIVPVAAVPTCQSTCVVRFRCSWDIYNSYANVIGLPQQNCGFGQTPIEEAMQHMCGSSSVASRLSTTWQECP